jgi:hypothetical protein
VVRNVVEAANFVFVQLIQQEPGMHDKFHADCARRNKIDLAWEKNSHEMESESCPKKYKHLSLNCHGRTDAPNDFLS